MTPMTPSQTIGPFFLYGLQWANGERLFPDTATGRAIRLSGMVQDGEGKPVSDALLEFWQPDAEGNFGGPLAGTCAGFGRVPTDGEGRYAIQTRLPGQVPGADMKRQAPHIVVVVFARGLLHQLLTRVYFDGEAANEGDAVLASCGARGATLLAKRDPGEADAYRWDIVLQGSAETVFFEA